MFALFVVKYQISNVAKPVLLLVGKDRNDEELLKERVLKASLSVYKILYYSTMTIVGYLILKDTDILPPWLGGSGALENAFKDYPYQPQYPHMLTYSLVCLGYYLEETMDHNIYRPKNSDFWEMNLHHVITICLVSNMLFMNAVSAGAFCLFFHMICDITVSVSKFFSHTIYKTATVISFAVTTALWIYTRNFVMIIYTMECWKGWVYPEELKQFQIANTLLASFLTILSILHLYWTCLFLNMFLKYDGKTTENTQSQSMAKKSKV
jgi:ceramide synthetase